MRLVSPGERTARLSGGSSVLACILHLSWSMMAVTNN